MTEDFEKLGLFYLGRRYDVAARKAKEELVLYDAKDLVTHAVCIGMTGSGKTGLCLGLVEEAAIDGIPVIAIDPKGDLSNLLLTFPNLAGKDFAPWVNEDDARRAGQSTEQFADQQANLWKEGLQAWGQNGERIKKLHETTDFRIYTPGSTAGLPVSIVQSLTAPPADILEDTDAMRERITGTATCLLALLGVSADPLKSKEHILISNILDKVWRQGVDLTLPTLIQQIQKPPMTQIGALDIESFFPSKERFELAMSINNLLAAPGFDVWLSGSPMDVGSFLYGQSGKPRVSIFSIAHLSDAERMFFVSLLLNQMISWMRSQPGTTSLRAILYMDEIFGFFPPTANPPSKTPLLTLLKQARAFGLGVVLASQNPVDLDYKGLANTGTWFIGRLQTERDKMRVLEGLEGAAATSGSTFDRQKMAQTLAGLGSRVFLMNNVHEDAPEIFETRWTMSYLRGPLTRNQIKALMAPFKAEQASRALQSQPQPQAPASNESSTGNKYDSRLTPAVNPAANAAANPVVNPAANAAANPAVNPAANPAVNPAISPSSTPSTQSPPPGVTAAQTTRTSAAAQSAGQQPAMNSGTAAPSGTIRPVLPNQIVEYFLPFDRSPARSETLWYRPALLAMASVRFTDLKARLDASASKCFLLFPAGDGMPFNWSDAEELKLSVEKLNTSPDKSATYSALPSSMSQPVNYKLWQKDLVAWICAHQKYYLLYSAAAKEYSRQGESQRDFCSRVQHALTEERDEITSALRKKYAPRLTALEDRIRLAQQNMEREAEAAKEREMESAISIGATIIGAVMGRKVLSARTINKAQSAARGVGRAGRQQQEVAHASETLDSLRERLHDLESEFRQEMSGIDTKMKCTTDSIETTAIAPKKSGIAVTVFALAWAPYVSTNQGQTALWR